MQHSLETIHYQYKDRFVEELKALLETIYKDIKGGHYETTNQIITKHIAVPALEKLFMERLGLNIEITKDLYVLSPAAIIPFFGDYFRGYKTTGFFKGFGTGVKFGDILKKIEQIEKNKLDQMRKAHNKEGYVDLKHAKVGGYLSELRHFLLLDFVWMYRAGIDVNELAAITCHELGHAFDGLEEHYRLESTNRAIFDILCDLRGGQEERAVYKFKNTFTESEFKKSYLENNQDRIDFAGELALQYLGSVNSQYLDSKYDETNFENMADSFATRFGLGKEIVSGLNKLHLSGGQVFPRNAFGYGVTTTIYVMSAAAILLIAPPFGAAAYFTLAALFMGKRNADMTYDLPIDRYQRIKNTIVNALKDTKLPTDITKDLLEQVYFIDAIIDEYMHNPPSWGEMFADFVIPTNRNAKYYIELQQRIERNLNNPLFIKSAELRTL